ncbi:MAG: NAD(P)(+) transhydrogenase (Re/Si-specific) subunit beta [Kiritimatiellaeota bacterium]|nr:NAD(P)(+) transhydrogenase (Re/Si-specific) subunit beta [Kiritimatiellota bacterium]
MEHLIHLVYLAAAICFILALKWLSAVPTARRGVITGIAGMLLAVGGTLALLWAEVPAASWATYRWILTAFVIGSCIGVPMALMPMTAVPQRTALSHAFGALAAALVGTAEFYLRTPQIGTFVMTALALEVLLGYLTFTASLMAFGKLQGILPTRPMTYRGQNVVNLGLFGLAVLVAIWLILHPGHRALFPVLSVMALIFGICLIIPIGGADMPTVISLLNAYAGLSASAMGFVLNNKLLIIAGALDGSSGLILSIIMCKAMNRSFANVLFGAFGQVQMAAAAGEQKPAHSATPEEAASLLENAQSVMIVPGYGMAVAQAQHAVRELFEVLTKRGIKVAFAIHPVAGRMPGHMNVLLAEANIPYDRLIEMEDANIEMSQVDVALVIGANDVTNPAARNNKASPIYGMPILDVDKARTVMVIKRSLNPGFAGIDNELYYLDKTLMLFGDAKAFTLQLVKQLGANAA